MVPRLHDKTRNGTLLNPSPTLSLDSFPQFLVWYDIQIRSVCRGRRELYAPRYICVAIYLA